MRRFAVMYRGRFLEPTPEQAFCRRSVRPDSEALPGDAIEVWVRHEPQLVASAGAQSAPCRQLRHVDEPSGVRGDLKKQGGADER